MAAEILDNNSTILNEKMTDHSGRKPSVAGLHFVLLFSGTHRISSADSNVYRLIDEDLYRPIESHFDDNGARQFREKLANKDYNWFEATVVNSRGKENVLLRIGEKTDEHYIWVILAQPAAIAGSYEEQLSYLEAYHELGAMNTDVLFHYLPDRDEIRILTGSSERLDRTTYTSAEFGNLFLREMDPDDEDTRNGFLAFLDNMRGGLGEFSFRAKGDLLTDDGRAEGTVFFCRTIYHSNGDEGVVGLIHPESGESGPGSRAETDKLTGLLSKDAINRLARKRLSENHPEGTALAILDVDYFKSVNDTFGHRVGDTVLRRIANIIAAELSGIGAAGRFGGDEFFLVLYLSDEDTIRSHMRNLKNLVSAAFPEMGAGGTQPLSVSIGVACAPKDADNYDDLFMLADYCVYVAKFKGRDRYIIYTPEKHGTIEQIRKTSRTPGSSFVTGREAAPGDIIVDMEYRCRYGDRPPVESLISEFASEFRISNVILFTGKPLTWRAEGWEHVPVGMETENGAGAVRAGSDNGSQEVGTDTGSQIPAAESVNGKFSAEAETEGFADERQHIASCVQRLDDHLKEIQYRNAQMIVVNTMLNLPDQFSDVRSYLKSQNIESTILIHINGRSGQRAVLMLNSLRRRIQWNQQQFMYFRTFADLIGEIL